MISRLRTGRHGQTLLEAVFALAVLMVAVAGLLAFAPRVFSLLERSRDALSAARVTEEGTEALRSIAASSWSSLVPGTYGLARAGGAWQLQANPDTIDGRYTRTVTIASAYRDAACAVVATPGTLDPDTKTVTIAVAWVSGGTPRTEVSRTHLTNWRAANALCAATDAGNLSVNVSAACMGGEQKQLEGVVLRNTGLRDVALDRVTITWVKADGRSPGSVRSVKINGQDRWSGSASGDWSPSGDQPSGTALNIQNVTIAAGGSATVDRFRFDTKLAGATFTLQWVMADASTTPMATAPSVAECDD